jgi:hypothetical protein
VAKALEPKMNIKKDKLPPAGHYVMVQCEGYRGLAYRNKNGQWKKAADNKNLTNGVELLPFRTIFRNYIKLEVSGK